MALLSVPKLSRLVLSLLVVVVLATGVFGMWQMVGPHMDAGTGGCPLMVGMATLCNMNALEHLSLWQSMFTAVRPDTVLLGLILAVCTLCAVWVRRLLLRDRHGLPSVTLRSYAQKRLLFASLDPVREALSRGILHPKIYG